MRRKDRRIGVVAFGRVPELVLEVVCAHIVGYLRIPAEIMMALEDPIYAYDATRLQYNAMNILRVVEQRAFKHHEKVIGILEGDLFIPTMTYVFGEARQGGRVALVSLYRLRRDRDGGTAPMARILERMAKVSLHELGHLYELVHCPDRRCIMHFSGSVEDLDEIPLFFCRYCNQYLRERWGREPRV